MRPKPLLACVVLLALGACGDDGGGGDGPPVTGATAGCPVARTAVEEALGRAVVVERGNAEGTCAFVPHEGTAAGARVEVVVSSLADQGFAAALADVERRSGPAELLGDDAVDGAERGWVVTVGRSVQVGAADGERLTVVVVTDPLLDGAAARDVAIDLAGQVLG